MRTIISYVIGGIAGLAVYLYMTGFFTGVALPECNDDGAKGIISKFSEQASEQSNLTFIELTDIKQLAFNEKKGIRACEGKMYLRIKGDTQTNAAKINYDIVWKDKEKNLFMLVNLRQSPEN